MKTLKRSHKARLKRQVTLQVLKSSDIYLFKLQTAQQTSVRCLEGMKNQLHTEFTFK